MGNPLYVLEKYISHVMHDIHTTSSMKFAAERAPIVPLSSFYVIGDTEDADECFISAHGSGYQADYVLDNENFIVPGGVNVRFYQPAGYALSCSTQQLRFGRPQQAGGAADLEYGPGAVCPNYILAKLQGRHAGVDDEESQEDYVGLQRIAADAGVVLLSVRNRWFHAGATLKNAIQDIREVLPDIVTFNCMICRVDDSTVDHARVWNASPVNGRRWEDR